MKLSCHNLTRKFGDTTALNGVNLCLDEPKIYGLLGRNGAGKTTLLRLITNYIQPTEGTITLDEQNVWENEKAQHQIFLITESSFFEDLTGQRLADIMEQIYPSFDKEQFLSYAKRFELNLKKKYQTLSTGYKSVLRAVAALSVHTPFLFLDEPTLGMDAFHRELFYKLLIESYSESPSCILLSTHLISEVEGLLENVIILDHGKVLIDESSEQLLAQGYCVSGRISDVDDYCSGKNVIGSSVVGGLKTTAILGERNNVPDTLDVTGLSLQQLFVQLVGSEALA
ncbi:ABC transporter ATP-binding protein [Negativibacillus massiliensis]|uniref:ABC transporter ATP-binding protein n=1 Tax=Negativibacillus massiliensis TaxID=1871035 RepID=UPI002A804FB3|nr:ABC transporter ATP-binding protein [Negativibacillus massiliensis]MDY4048477.1 ABC transporter ATP-binding protein [Negativibacillus massiliensis]